MMQTKKADWMRRSRRHQHATKPAVLQWIAIAIALCLIPSVSALELTFSHSFTYENSAQVVTDDLVFLDNKTSPVTTTRAPTPTTVRPPIKRMSPSANAKQQRSYGPTTRVRWNTHAIVTSFGMETGARVELEITSLAYTFFPQYGSSKQVPVVFSLYDIDQWRAYSVLQLRDMPLKSPTILCHYPAAMRYAVTERQFNVSRPKPLRVAFDVTKPSLYTLQVQVCGDASVYVAGRTSLINIGYDQKLSEHLAVEELGLIPLYKVFIFIYSCFSLLWIVDGFIHRKTVSNLGHTVQIAIHVKTIEAFIKLWYYRELSMFGRRETNFRIASDIADSLSSAVVLCVMLLASLGWSITRDTLTPRERRLIASSFIFYAMIALVKATCDANEEEICKAYMLTEYLMKSIMMLGVIVALNFTISQLRLTLNETRWNNLVTPLMYMKLNQFQNFRYVFLGYLLVPTSLLVLNLVVITPPGFWRYDWVNYFLQECATLGIFIGVALNLRPIDTYAYNQLSRGTAPGAATSLPSAPSAPINGSVVVPAAMPLNDPPLTAAERTIEANRQLLRQYAATMSPLSSPPPPPTRRAPPPSFSPTNLMLSPMARHM